MKNILKINNDITVKEFFKRLSKANLNKLVLNKAIKRNGLELSLEDNLKRNDELEINYSLLETNKDLIATKMDLNIIYEDSDFIAVCKERNIIIHQDGVNFNTITNGLIYYLQSKNDDSYIRCLHRIDKDTQGVVLFSKNIFAHASLSYDFENQLVKKTYLALVNGIIKKDGEINVCIGKNRHDSSKYLVTKTGKSASLKYKVLGYLNNQTKVLIDLQTGRPHQIRVSFAYIKHSVVGDKLYGYGNHLMLISSAIAFTFLDKKYLIKSKRTF